MVYNAHTVAFKGDFVLAMVLEIAQKSRFDVAMQLFSYVIRFAIPYHPLFEEQKNKSKCRAPISTHGMHVVEDVECDDSCRQHN
ncbi:hypothetical protein SERLA73DRAFT_192001 [Serpula lacrymans var. lacrymans S7.3]|uniref:Uncharacterized protein n=2 Tax=Serpula lacrymans var. lacrymans TaxID=341189 RepID=F8QIR8_SERL3|nr:uncharacterized protein SERLADRAFT_479106 [Serpula lacrymans var. lacrymans S7.9]EGN91790.1 hypothetical protein SERLA73DRAFT_192001 [Serpula lacrymans var. lacrymans S7.3]EGO19553.1 hypothetical protein SERLADRAFT_479106 [Serpula lacrymans var. lacrymans S7.9]